MRRATTTLNRTIAGAIGGVVVGFSGLILIVPVCAPKTPGPAGVGDYALGLTLCLTVGPALGIALAHLCLRRPPSAPKNPPPAQHK